MSQHAKSVIAAFVAVVYVAITGWQQVTTGGFRWADLLPLAVIVVGAIQTYLAPNVPELPWMKALVAGSAAVLSALATLVAQDPAGVTASKLLTAGAGAFLVWFVPEFGYLPATTTGAHLITDAPTSAAPTTTPAAAAAPIGDSQEITDALHQLEQLNSAVTATAAGSTPAPGVDAAAAELAAPSVYDQLMAEHTASFAAVPAAAPVAAAMGPDLPAEPPAPIPAPADVAPATAPMAAVAAGSTPAVPASA